MSQLEWAAELLALPKAKIAVLYGGNAAERDISLMSGSQVLEHLQDAGADAFGIDIAGDGAAPLAQLQRAEFDVAFIAVHGRGGEDGALQGALQLLGKPYTGSGVLASAVAMDKLKTKQLWRSHGLSTPAACHLHQHSDWSQVSAELGLPLVVKPVHEGSSLGIAFPATVAELEQAYRDAAAFDRAVMAEQLIVGDEYTVTLLDDQALPAIRLETDNPFYDLEAKYYSDATRYLFHNPMTAEQQAQLEEECLQAFHASGCRHWGRVDVMRDGAGRNWLLEVNTVPGMTSHSLVPMAAQRVGLSFAQTCLLLVNLALREVP